MQSDSRVKAKSDLGSDAESPAEMTGPDPILVDIDGKPIDPIWAAEVRGFFWGEGCFQIQDKHGGDGGSGLFNTLATIGLRSDDGAVLREIQRRIGGRIRHYVPSRGNPITLWSVNKPADCLRLARVLLSTSGLPFKKQRELPYWHKAVRIKRARSTGLTINGRAARGHYLPEDREYFALADAALRQLKKWDGNNAQ